MILVTLGTQKQQFTRLLEYIENANIKDEIIVQAGFTKFNSKKMKIFDFIDYDEMNEYIDKADLIITHAGTGSIVSALKKDKKVIACARLSKYLEHVDNHQEEILDVFYEEGYILKIDEELNLDDVYNKSKSFKPKKFISNTEKFIKLLEKEINNDSKRQNKRNVLFTAIFIFITIFCSLYVVFREPQIKSNLENRLLNQIPSFSLKEFHSGIYQDKLEDAYADQMIAGFLLKKINIFIKSFNRDVINYFLYDKGDNVPLERGIFNLENSGYLVYYPKTMKQYEEGLLNSNLDIINNLAKKYKNIDFKAFRIRTDVDINVNKELDFLFNEKLDFEYDSTKYLNNYDDYKDYFYKSDHHWNYKGSFLGYEQIIDFLDEKSKFKTGEVICFNDTYFQGSMASLSNQRKIKDEFCVYDLEDPKLKIEVWSETSKYGNSKEYLKGNYPKGIYNMHYGDYYGGNYGQVIFNNQEANNGKKILLFVDSMSSPINKLIAFSYKTTYVVDLRRYELYVKEKFNTDDYLKKYNFDEVVFLGNINLFSNEEFIPKLKGVEDGI